MDMEQEWPLQLADDHHKTENRPLSDMVTKNAPKMDEVWHKQSVALCECCGKMFIKQGNRQKYCKDPLCQAERKNRKARDYYQRKHSNSTSVFQS